MQHDDDYLLVNGDFSVGANVSGSSNHLTAGTVEVKGDFKQTSDITGYYCYNETGTHKTILSGNETQTVSFECYYSGRNKFENLILENTDVYFSTPIYQLKLCEDTTVTNENPIEIYDTLNTNGYAFKASGNMTAKKVQVTGNDNEINGSLNATNLLSFNSGSLKVGGACTVYVITMQHEDDYLFINGDFTVKSGYDSSVSYNHLSAGTVELKGNFYQKYSSSYVYYGYNETGTHKTILSGNEVQTVTFAAYKNGNKFNTLISENSSEEGIVFASPVTVSRLFNHKGNNFTLYNNGNGSSFVDFDRDGLNDNVDPDPTNGRTDIIDAKIETIGNQKLEKNTACTPELYIIYNGAELEKNTDYTAVFSNNTVPGTASVTVTGMGDYIGSIAKIFTIYCQHNYVCDIVAPTCTAQGYNIYTCDICGNNYKDTYVSALSHNYELSSFENNCAVFSCVRCDSIYNEPFSEHINQRDYAVLDMNGDGIVNAKDYAYILKNY